MNLNTDAQSLREKDGLKHNCAFSAAKPVVMLFFILTVLMFISTLNPSLAMADEPRLRYFYRVRRHDSLSAILYRLGIKPIYGVRGTCKKTLALNPNSASSQGDAIFPGEMIYLPLDIEAQLASSARVLPTGEVIASEPALIAPADREAVRTLDRKTAEAPADTPTDAASPLDLPEQTKKRSEITDEPDQFISITPRLNFTRIQTRDKINGGKLDSTDGNYGLNINYSQKWSNTLELFATLNWYKMDLKSPIAETNITSQNSYLGFNVGMNFRLSESLTVGTSFGFEQQPLISAVSLDRFLIERVGLIQLGASVSKVLTQSANQHFLLISELGGALTLPRSTQNFDVSAGYFVYARLAARAKLGHRTQLEVGPYYRIQSLNTNLIEEDLSNLGLSAQFEWAFGNP